MFEFNDLNEKFAIVVSSSDNYIDLIDGFIYFWEKNFPDNPFEVFFLLENKKYHLIESKYNFYYDSSKSWSRRLYNLLDSIKKEYVIILLEDWWVLDPINTDEIKIILSFAIDNHTDYLSYSSSKQKDFIISSKRQINNIEFYKVSKKAILTKYLIGAGNIVNRVFFMKILRSDENPWEFEINASLRYFFSFYNENYRFIANGNPFKYIDGGIIEKGMLRESAKKKLDSVNYNLVWENISKDKNNLKRTFFSIIFKKTLRIIKSYVNILFNKMNNI